MPSDQPLQLFSYRQIAKMMGTNPHTISDIVRSKRIKTHPVPLNGRAIGIDPEGLETIRRALQPETGQAQKAKATA